MISMCVCVCMCDKNDQVKSKLWENLWKTDERFFERATDRDSRYSLKNFTGNGKDLAIGELFLVGRGHRVQKSISNRSPQCSRSLLSVISSSLTFRADMDDDLVVLMIFNLEKYILGQIFPFRKVDSELWTDILCFLSLFLFRQIVEIKISYK